MLDDILGRIRRIIPRPVFEFFNAPYHLALAFLGAAMYGFPSKKIKVIAVTGTKGKSTTTELISAILEAAGHRTALSNTIRFKVAGKSRPNLYKMSMPGRSFMQKLLRGAVRANCDYAVLEMTSQGALNRRHRFIEHDAFVLTNISPEHIEAHGSYEDYVNAKVSILTDGLVASPKKNRVAVVNADDQESPRFLFAITDKDVKQVKYSISDLEPYEAKAEGLSFTVGGTKVESSLSGLFNLSNIAAAIAVARTQLVTDDAIIRALQKFSSVPGRVERIEAGPAFAKTSAGKQDFSVIVDYAHTPDSLEKLYRAFRPDPKAPRGSRIIAVLGGTGGGRDNWKRKEMGKLADEYCDMIILTDEDPYDEDPNKIVADVAEGITSKKPLVIMDRRLAIREAISKAQKGDAVLITGKGTDPYIMGPHGAKTPWSDAKIAREELESFLKEEH